MDSDAKTCGKCKHGNFYDNCQKCEDAYEQSLVRQKKCVARDKGHEARKQEIEVGYKVDAASILAPCVDSNVA